MEKIKNISLMTYAVFGSIIVAVLLVLGTIWTGKNASHDTEQAVHSVSLLYLGELAERREQVVASTLAGNINDLDVAIGLIRKNDLVSLESLQAYQARMKQLYRLEKFAFVNSKGLIFTSRGTRTDIDQYSFDYKTLSKPEISIKHHESASKKVIIAMPVDRLPFEGDHLVVCFMEIDMNQMLKSISLQANISNTTFCNIYTNNGTALTDVVLGGLSSESNLLQALKHAVFQPGSSLEAMRADFQAKRAGVVSFTYNDIRETMCYVPVHGTDWMLTYLVRESVISNQISSIYEGIVSRNVLQSILTVLVLAGLFAIMLVQLRKSSQLSLERELSETANRIRQQELEEQIALKEQLLEQEKQRAEQDNMITALAADYKSVYYINLEENQGICYRSDPGFPYAREEGDHFSFSEAFSEYAHKYVHEQYQKGFLDFIKPEAIFKRLKENSIIGYRYLVLRDGQERYEMLRMARVSIMEGRNQHIHVVGAGFTDIDAEMRDEMAKSQALSDALTAAEEASKAKTTFLSNMSHEIRTPMNAIIGLDNLALNEPDVPEKTRDYLRKIDSAAQHLLSLINDILDMSRIESGRMIVHNEEFSLSRLMEQINTIISGQCKEKGLTYSCHINGQVDDNYIGDNIKLRQVLINILGNAVKFTPQGGSVNFHVERTAAFDNKSTLTFTIADNGIGMSSEFLPRLFDTFSQEDSSVSNKYGSSGLGMAITKNIVDMMNGKIDVKSEKGVGTTFTVAITMLDAEKKTDDNGDDIEIRPHELNVLVVDDDPVACDHAHMLLEQAGFASDTVLSGQDALTQVRLRNARQEPYNLIIMDWQMPGMDGIETTRNIRTMIGDETAIIFLTAYNYDDVREEAVKAGVDAFIAKPLFSGNLIDEFKNALRKKRLSQDHSRQKADLRGRKILLAEDVQVNAEIMEQVLEMREMQTDLAENGRIAVEKFAAHPEGYYAAILMDMRMPEMNGIEATMAIRAMERKDAKTIPIIALTANAFDEDVQRSLQAGLNAHLSKPVNPDTLFSTLENIINVAPCERGL